MYVCLCKGITESDVRKLGRAGRVSAEGLAKALGIDRDGCCGRCVEQICELVNLANADRHQRVKISVGISS